MKLHLFVEAKPRMEKLVSKELPLKTAHRLFQMATAMNEHLSFFEKKRMAILDTYGEAKGNKYVPKEGTGNTMNEKILELLNMEIEWDMEPVAISMEEDIRITSADITALEPFVKFKEE